MKTKSIRISEEAYNYIKKLAEDTKRTMTATLDILIFKNNKIPSIIHKK